MPNPEIALRFDEIYDSTNKAVLAFITAKCGQTTDICDIYQDTYMELYQVLIRRGVDYVTNERALVLRIAKRKVARYYSLLERLKIFVSINFITVNEDEVDISDFEPDAFLTEDFSIKHDTLDSITQFIQSKPEDVQKVFYLKYNADLSIAEIAQALGTSESGIKNKLYRTLKEIRNILN